MRKTYGGKRATVEFVNLAPDRGGWSLLGRFTPRERVRSTRCIKGCVGVTTGLDPQAVETTEVHTPADNLTAAVRSANHSLVPVLNMLYFFSKILKLKHFLYFRSISENITFNV